MLAATWAKQKGVDWPTEPATHPRMYLVEVSGKRSRAKALEPTDASPTFSNLSEIMCLVSEAHFSLHKRKLDMSYECLSCLLIVVIISLALVDRTSTLCDQEEVKRKKRHQRMQTDNAYSLLL